MRPSSGAQPVTNSCTPNKTEYSSERSISATHKHTSTDGLRNKFFKTRLCPYHFKKGSTCKGGDNCSYAHSFHELRPSVDLTKTKVCHEYLYGTCKRNAEECPFAHGDNDHRNLPLRVPDRSSLSQKGGDHSLNMPLKNLQPYHNLVENDFWPRDTNSFTKKNDDGLSRLRSGYLVDSSMNQQQQTHPFLTKAKTFDFSGPTGFKSNTDSRRQHHHHHNHEGAASSDPAYEIDKPGLWPKTMAESTEFCNRQFSGCSSCTTSFGPIQPGLSIETTISGNDDIIARAGIFDQTINNAMVDKPFGCHSNNNNNDDESKHRLLRSLMEVTSGSARRSNYNETVQDIIVANSEPEDLSPSKLADFCSGGRSELPIQVKQDNTIKPGTDGIVTDSGNLLGNGKFLYGFDEEEHHHQHLKGTTTTSENQMSQEVRASLTECFPYNERMQYSTNIDECEDIFVNQDNQSEELEAKFELTMSQLVEIISIARTTMNVSDLVAGVTRRLTRKL